MIAFCAIRIQSLPDLQAATKWLTNSNYLWQGVENLLNNGSSLLLFNMNPHHQT
jgi:hypothetical protein